MTVDTFTRARTIQTTRAASTNAMLDGILCQMLYHVTRAAASDLRFRVLACLPQACDVPQPQVRSLHINRRLTDVMLNVGVVNFFLRCDILQSILVSGFGSPQKSGGIVWDKAGLPSLL